MSPRSTFRIAVAVGSITYGNKIATPAPAETPTATNSH